MKNLATKYKPEIEIGRSWIVVFLLGMLFSTIIIAQDEDPCEVGAYVLSAAAKNAACAGNNTGNATVASTGCNCLYSGCTYLWSDGQTFHTAFDLSAGTYSVTVTHPNGCVLSTEVEVQEYASFIEDVTVKNATSCSNEGGGEIEVIPTDDAGPLTFEWSNGETTAMLTDVRAGTYELKVTNFVGCEYIETIEIEGPENAEVIVTTYDSCKGENNGRAEIEVNGGVAPYEFSWNGIDSREDNWASNLEPGEHQLLVTDAIGCTYEAIAIIEEIEPDVSIVANTDNICPNEEVELSIIGGVAFELLNIEEQTNKQSQTVSVYPTQTTTYEITIETETGCITTQSITIHVLDAPQPNIIAPVTIICEGQETQLIATENSGANFTWSPAEGLSNTSGNVTIASPMVTTTYTLTASNNTGCTTTKQITIDVAGCISTGIEDLIGSEGIALFPNPNNGIFQLQFELTEVKTIRLQLYNTIGQVIEQFEGDNQLGIFNRSFDLSAKPAGLYYLELEIEGERHLEKIMVY